MQNRPAENEKENGAFSLNRLLLTAILSLAAILGSALYAKLSPAAEDTDTRREACIHACEADQVNCRDTTGARMDTFDAPSNILGTGAKCDKDLRDCLKNCH